MIEKLLQEDQSRHAVQLLGRAAQCGMKMLGDFAERHEMKNLHAEKTRPVATQILDRHRRKHHLIRVEQFLLSWINSVSHKLDNLHANLWLR